MHISGLMRVGIETTPLPSLMDPSSRTRPGEPDSGHVHCFSNPCNDFSNPMAMEFPPLQSGFGFGFGFQDPSVIRTFLAMKQRDMISVSQETVLSTENSSVVSNLEIGKKPFEEQSGRVDPQDFDSLWSYGN